MCKACDQNLPIRASIYSSTEESRVKKKDRAALFSLEGRIPDSIFTLYCFVPYVILKMGPVLFF